MKVTIDIPPDIEKKLFEKCDEAGVSPSEFIYALLEWYFLKKKKKTPRETSEFIEVAMKIAEERTKFCKYSDGMHCALEVLDDIYSEKEPEPITSYKCLFCLDFHDRRRTGKVKLYSDDSEKSAQFKVKLHDIARLAAKYVVEMYGDKLGYQPKMLIDESEEERPRKRTQLSKNDVKKLLDNW